jgi:hypothetical protein
MWCKWKVHLYVGIHRINTKSTLMFSCVSWEVSDVSLCSTRCSANDHTSCCTKAHTVPWPFACTFFVFQMLNPHWIKLWESHWVPSGTHHWFKAFWHKPYPSLCRLNRTNIHEIFQTWEVPLINSRHGPHLGETLFSGTVTSHNKNMW